MIGEVATPPPAAVPLRHSPLQPFHLAQNAHLVPFAGWEMPLYYTGILDEHLAVRERVGFFDVSHMGILTVAGPHATDLLSRRTTANVSRLEPGQCRYTFLLDTTGAIVDDLLITRLDDDSSPARTFLVVPNARTTHRIIEILRQHRLPDTTIHSWNGQVALVAVQGPGSRKILTEELELPVEGLGFYRARHVVGGVSGAPVSSETLVRSLTDGPLVSRTGYTGELGFEILLPAEAAVGMAERLVRAGVVPCGLGARDTLRLEKGYLLSGQEFSRDHSPLEAGQGRFVEFDHVFIGRPALEKQKADGIPVALAALSVIVPGAIPRHGAVVLVEGKPVGMVTSGGLSPTLNHGIALAYLPPPLAQPGRTVSIDIRGKPVEATVVSLPFVPNSPPR